MFDNEYGVEQELNQELAIRIVNHRNRFARLFRNRYLEMLPTIITYYNGTDVNVDWVKVELALRYGYHVVIGRDRLGNTQMLGFVTSFMTPSNPSTFLFPTNRLSYDDINWIVPHDLKPHRKDFKEITKLDNCKTGSFVVLRNKTVNYVNDMEIIDHYVSELAEIVCSRYSVTMQAKILTFLTGEKDDETINEVVKALYNGTPYAKVSGLFDPDEHINQWTTFDVSNLLVELKREYQNKIGELNMQLGINSLAVDKSSGVSDIEANSNRASTTAISNIYLLGRNNALKDYNKRYGTELYAIYNDDAISKMTLLENQFGDTTPQSNYTPENPQLGGHNNDKENSNHSTDSTIMSNQEGKK
jgi:hypothetical protein